MKKSHFLKIILPLLVMSVFVAGCPKKKTTTNDTKMNFASNYQDPNSSGNMGNYNADLLDSQGLEGRGGDNYTREVRGQLQPVYFAFDQSHIRPNERAKVQAAASYLQANPNKGILVEGHCDWRGTTEYNLGLGDRRANSVKSYLESLGVYPERIRVASKGDLEATVNGSLDQTARDRRGELVILE